MTKTNSEPQRSAAVSWRPLSLTRDEFEIQFRDIFDQINAYAAGAPINVVNPAVTPR